MLYSVNIPIVNSVRTQARTTTITAVRTTKGNRMFLQEISSSVAQRNIGKLFSMANKKVTLLTRLNKEDVVVMSKKQYTKLLKAAGD